MRSAKIFIILFITLSSLLLLLTGCQAELRKLKIESNKISFISNRNEEFELFMVDKQGNNIKKMIETNNEEIVNIAFDPNLRYIILDLGVRNDNIKRKTLYLYDKKLKKKSLICKDGSYPSWSPNGKRFVYTRDTKDEETLLILSDTSLKQEKVLLKITDYPIPWRLSWKPDGTEILLYRPYGYHKIEETDVLYSYIISEDKIKEIKLDKKYKIYNAAWSPVENKIAAGIYNHDIQKYVLSLIDPDTGKVTQLKTIKKELYSGIDWSTNGNYLVFSAKKLTKWPRRTDDVDVFIYDIKNDEIRDVSKSDAIDYKAQWIP